MVKKLTFWFDCWIVLNFGPSHRAYFSLRNDSLWTKIRVQMDEKSQKYQNPNKIFTEFFKKTGSFLPDFAQWIVPIGWELDWAGWTILKNKVLANFHQKDSRYLLWIGSYEFFKKKCPEFFNFVSPSFRAWFLNDHSSKLNEARLIRNYTSRAFRAYKI